LLALAAGACAIAVEPAMNSTVEARPPIIFLLLIRSPEVDIETVFGSWSFAAT
jgi:hypothetical protein